MRRIRLTVTARLLGAPVGAASFAAWPLGRVAARACSRAFVHGTTDS